MEEPFALAERVLNGEFPKLPKKSPATASKNPKKPAEITKINKKPLFKKNCNFLPKTKSSCGIYSMK